MHLIPSADRFDALQIGAGRRKMYSAFCACRDDSRKEECRVRTSAHLDD